MGGLELPASEIAFAIIYFYQECNIYYSQGVPSLSGTRMTWGVLLTRNSLPSEPPGTKAKGGGENIEIVQHFTQNKFSIFYVGIFGNPASRIGPRPPRWRASRMRGPDLRARLPSTSWDGGKDKG